MSDDVLEMYTIYDSPADYPGKYVVRRQVIGPGTVAPDDEPLIVCDTLWEARRAIPRTAGYRMPRDVSDDPVIVETWL